METFATHKNARISARKVRVYRDLLKGLSVRMADSQLRFLPGKSPKIMRAVLHSAIANAKNNFNATEDSLVVSDVIVDMGFSFKRFRPVSKGMAHPFIKRTAHVTVVVKGDVAEQKPVAKKKTTRKRVAKVKKK